MGGLRDDEDEQDSGRLSTNMPKQTLNILKKKKFWQVLFLVTSATCFVLVMPVLTSSKGPGKNNLGLVLWSGIMPMPVLLPGLDHCPVRLGSLSQSLKPALQKVSAAQTTPALNLAHKKGLCFGIRGDHVLQTKWGAYVVDRWLQTLGFFFAESFQWERLTFTTLI